MVVRYPHTATVTAVVTTVTDGEYASESETTTEIKGRIEPSEGIARVKKPNGEYTDIMGKFFTKADKIDGAETLAVDGVTYTIIYWWEYQTYSEIWLD
jgi:hypothetical protein